MKKIAVINQKGGVGKTTSTANLGAALARAGHRVLLIDFDPQGHLSLHYGYQTDEEAVSAYDVLTDDTPLTEALVEVRSNVALLPADIHLAAAESELVSVMGREVILREALEPLEDDYDFLLIDCPPSVGVLTVNALAAAEEVLIPLQAQFFALQGFAKLLEKTVTLVHKRINPELSVRGVVLCMHEGATRLAGEVVQEISSFLEAGRNTSAPWANASLFSRAIRRNIKLAEACSFGQTIFDYAPRSNGAIDYLWLAKEVFPEADIAIPSWMDPSGTRQADTKSGTSSGTRKSGLSKRAESVDPTGNGNSSASHVDDDAPASVAGESAPEKSDQDTAADLQAVDRPFAHVYGQGDRVDMAAPKRVPPKAPRVRDVDLAPPDVVTVPRAIPVIDLSKESESDAQAKSVTTGDREPDSTDRSPAPSSDEVVELRSRGVASEAPSDGPISG
ncbi:MAG: ParA family protein [Phycisphaerae bacterium]